MSTTNNNNCTCAWAPQEFCEDHHKLSTVTFDQAPEHAVLSGWGKPDAPTLPTVEINGYTASLAPMSDPELGRVHVSDGIGQLDCLLVKRSPGPGWDVDYTNGCTYSFVTIMEAMAHAVSYLV